MLPCLFVFPCMSKSSASLYRCRTSWPERGHTHWGVLFFGQQLLPHTVQFINAPSSKTPINGLVSNWYPVTHSVFLVRCAGQHWCELYCKYRRGLHGAEERGIRGEEWSGMSRKCWKYRNGSSGRRPDRETPWDREKHIRRERWREGEGRRRKGRRKEKQRWPAVKISCHIAHDCGILTLVLISSVSHASRRGLIFNSRQAAARMGGGSFLPFRAQSRRWLK